MKKYIYSCIFYFLSFCAAAFHARLPYGLFKNQQPKLCLPAIDMATCIQQSNVEPDILPAMQVSNMIEHPDMACDACETNNIEHDHHKIKRQFRRDMYGQKKFIIRPGKYYKRTYA